jgi:Tfp pilus assembly protein PilX
MRSRIASQRGATLIIALIMLVLLTLFALSGLNTGTSDLQIVGNMQGRSEAVNAAQEAIETVISTPNFISTPANAVLTPCGAANTLCTDVTGDGTPEYRTTLTPAPTCVAVTPIMANQLNFFIPDDLGCTDQQAQNLGVAGAVTGATLCANTVWEITAQTTGTISAATATVSQGVGVRISKDNMSTSCP